MSDTSAGGTTMLAGGLFAANGVFMSTAAERPIIGIPLLIGGIFVLLYGHYLRRKARKAGGDRD